MNNNNNNELKLKLEREIWLFQQWLVAIQDEESETQRRIQAAYQECIDTRNQQLKNLTEQSTESAELS